MYSILYFSPTGNAKHLAKKLAITLDVPAEDIAPLEFIKMNQLAKKDHLILLYPIHGFNASRTVKRFVKKLPQGLYKTISLIAVGCTDIWLNQAASEDLRKILASKNYTITVNEVLAMPLTFIMAFPEKESLKLITESEAQITSIANAIKTRTSSQNKIQFKSRIVNFLGKIENPAARLFGLELYANKNCDSCGICWNNCPEYNISEKANGKPKFAFSCSMCMRCTYQCPQKAISPRFSKFIPIKKGYNLNNLLNNQKH